jgi:hypothetical protein
MMEEEVKPIQELLPTDDITEFGEIQAIKILSITE